MPKCKICKTKFTAVRFLQKNCLNHTAKELADWSKGDREKKADKKHNERKRDFYDNDTKTRKDCAQKAFNAYIRCRDRSEACISCNINRDETAVGSGSNWHAGHFKSRGAASQHAFNEDNCHKQCAHCNNFLSGNAAEFRKNLIKRIGLERVLDIENDNDPIKRTASDEKERELKYKQMLKEWV